MTGPTVEAFGRLLCELLQASRADRLDRPGRRRPAGGGHDFDLPVADQFPLTVVWPRQYPTQEVLGYLFGASDSTAPRAARRCLPVLEAQGKDSVRLPDPGKGKRRGMPALLAGTPGLAAIVDTFEQRTRRPRRRQRAWYSGKKKAHTLKSQVAVDEDGRVVDVGASRPGPWADLKVLGRSGLAGRPARTGVGVLGDLAYVGVDGLVGGRAGRRPGGSRAAGAGHPRTGGTTGRSRGGGSRWGTPSAGCGGSRRWRRSTGTAARARGPGAGGGRAGQPHARSQGGLKGAWGEGPHRPTLILK